MAKGYQWFLELRGYMATESCVATIDEIANILPAGLVG